MSLTSHQKQSIVAGQYHSWVDARSQSVSATSYPCLYSWLMLIEIAFLAWNHLTLDFMVLKIEGVHRFLLQLWTLDVTRLKISHEPLQLIGLDMFRWYSMRFFLKVAVFEVHLQVQKSTRYPPQAVHITYQSKPPSANEAPVLQDSHTILRAHS